MKFYSEVTKKFYDSQDECLKAETQEKTKENERAKRAKEVEKAIADADAARKNANKLLNSFLADYGSFHSTIKASKDNVNDINEFSDIDDIDNTLRKLMFNFIY